LGLAKNSHSNYFTASNPEASGSIASVSGVSYTMALMNMQYLCFYGKEIVHKVIGVTFECEDKNHKGKDNVCEPGKFRRGTQ
jgi:hypothetical protein